jgi:Protein of unknown function (DUF3108)
MEKARAGIQSVEVSFALLSGAVLAVHLLLLQGTALILVSSEPPITRPFITRTIPATPVTPPQKPRPARRVKPAAPVAQIPAPQIEPVIQTPPVEEPPPLAAVPTPAEAAASAPAVDASAPQPTPPVAEAPRPVAVSVPGSMRLKYKINGEVGGFSYSASGELLWLHDGKTYDARMEVGAFLLGSRVQTSSGNITPEGLAPTRFGDKVKTEVAAHFVRDKDKIIFSANTPDVELQPGAQDQLSIFIQIASLIGGDPARYPKGTAIEMQAVGARDADIWRVVVGEEEMLHLPADNIPALKLTRPPQKAFDLNVELWLAPALGYLPVRIRLSQANGDFIDQQLRSSEPP